jgi:hypothetical protein
MLPSLALLNMNGVEINVDALLYGNDFLSDETNCEMFSLFKDILKILVVFQYNCKENNQVNFLTGIPF